MLDKRSLVRNVNILLTASIVLPVFGQAFLGISSSRKDINAIKRPIPIEETIGVCTTGGETISKVVVKDAENGQRGHLDWADDGTITGVDGYTKNKDNKLWYSDKPPCDVPGKVLEPDFGPSENNGNASSQ